MPERPLTPEELRWEQQLMDELLVRGMAPQQGPPVSLKAPTMRAASWLERFNERGKDAYEWLAESLLSPLKIPEALGMTDLRGKVKESADPEALFAGTMDLPPGKAISAAARGLYSRVDDALSRLPAKGAHPNKILSILKSNASQEELAYRKVPEFLAAQGNTPVTPGALQQHLTANPAPMLKVKTLGVERSSGNYKVVQDETGVSIVDPRGEVAWSSGSRQLSPEELQELTHNWHDAPAPSKVVAPTKYQQYQVPGGENYRETLLTLPGKDEGFLDWAKAKLGRLPSIAETAESGDLWREFQQTGQRERFAPKFISSHFDEPNVVVHTRANERTLPTGERGRFVEEVQSDWHQQGKKHGYQVPGGENMIDGHDYEWWNNRADSLFNMRSNPNLRSQISAEDMPRLEHDLALARENRNRLSIKAADVVPDAPFKETWPDLGLKQQLLETAADPDATWMGFTSGGTQAARYDLSKQISRVEYLPQSGPRLGTVRAYDLNGNQVIDKIAETSELPDIIGKEAADKLLSSEPRLGTGAGRAVHVLEGLDLQVGGEGMRKFYDELLPRRFEKMLKPFGGTVERGTLGRTKREIDLEMDALHNAPEWTGNLRDSLERLQAERNAAPDDAAAWIARLSPEMKARILKEGLPLMALPLAATAGLGWLGPLGSGQAADNRQR